MDWASLIVPYTQEEVQKYVKDAKWQILRENLGGKPLEQKFNMLKEYLRNNSGRAAEVRVANYVNALKRAGMI